MTISDHNQLTNSEKTLTLLLRFFGTTSLFALIFVAAPYSWMDGIHAWIGMGHLADQPVVGYLARSTSLLYAVMGGLFWTVSFDLRRHRKIVIYLGRAVVFMGAALLLIDIGEGMPLSWTIWEGPFVIAFGIAMLFLSRSIP